MSIFASAALVGYLATGGGASLDRFLHLGVHLEGGRRLGDTLLFARGQVSSGMSGDSAESRHGTFRQARAGLEARDCLDDGWLCGFTGLDLGYARERLMVPYADDASGGITNVTGLAAVPRLGFDGGTNVRVRVSLELPIHDAGVVGGGASLGFGYSF
jgi:hypothetical protein